MSHEHAFSEGAYVETDEGTNIREHCACGETRVGRLVAAKQEQEEAAE